MDYKKIFQKLKKEGKNTTNLIVLVLIGAFLVITASFFKPNNNSYLSKTPDKNTPKVEKTSNSKNLREEEEELENKLKDTLEEIDGVGRVKVMTNFGSSEEQIPALNVNDETNVTEEKDTAGGTRTSTQKNNSSNVVITNDGDGTSKPLIVKKYKPKVIGVIVIAEGAENKVTAMKLTKAVVDLFNLPTNKVNVYSMKK